MKNMEQFVQALAQMNIEVSEAQQAKLLEYLAMLIKWNSTYNLTAIRTEDKMLSYHILDSLSVVPFLPQQGSLLDVGSGGGMPGMVCAIMRPEQPVTLLDANHKKTTFLRQAMIELKLDNVTVETCRVEQLTGKTFDMITSRAFSSLRDFVLLSEALLAENGMWLAMKGVYPFEEVDDLPDNVMVKEVQPLEVPYIEGARHLVWLCKKDA